MTNLYTILRFSGAIPQLMDGVLASIAPMAQNHARALIHVTYQTRQAMANGSPLGERFARGFGRDALSWLALHLGRDRTEHLFEDILDARGHLALSVNVWPKRDAAFLVAGFPALALLRPEVVAHQAWANKSGIKLVADFNFLGDPRMMPMSYGEAGVFKPVGWDQITPSGIH